MSPGGLHRACCCAVGGFDIAILTLVRNDLQPLFIILTADGFTYELLSPTYWNINYASNLYNGLSLAQYDDGRIAFLYRAYVAGQYRTCVGKRSIGGVWTYETLSTGDTYRYPAVLAIDKNQEEWWLLQASQSPPGSSRVYRSFTVPTYTEFTNDDGNTYRHGPAYHPINDIPYYPVRSWGYISNPYIRVVKMSEPSNNAALLNSWPNNDLGLAFKSSAQAAIAWADSSAIWVKYGTLSPWVEQWSRTLGSPSTIGEMMLVIDRQNNEHLVFTGRNNAVYYGVPESGTDQFIWDQIGTTVDPWHVSLTVNLLNQPQVVYTVYSGGEYQIEARVREGQYGALPLTDSWLTARTAYPQSISGLACRDTSVSKPLWLLA